MSFDWRQFQGVNAAYVQELYERYRRDPQSVDEATREFFRTTDSEQPEVPSSESRSSENRSSENPGTLVGAINLAQSIRRYGHLAASIDPLGSRPLGDPALLPETHGVTEVDLAALPASLLSSAVADGATSMAEVVARLRALYCSTTGYDFAHIFVPEERRWLRHAVETGQFRAPRSPIDPVALLERITQVEAFEKFLHRTFPGKTRFSIEGLDCWCRSWTKSLPRRPRPACGRRSSAWRIAAG